MKERIEYYKVSPGGYEAMLGLEKHLAQCSIDEKLQNLIKRAVILSTGPTLDVPVAALNGRRATPAYASAPAGQLPHGREAETLETADRRHIIAALERTNWVIAGPNGAAARLGIKRSTLQFRMRKLGIVRTAPPH